MVSLTMVRSFFHSHWSSSHPIVEHPLADGFDIMDGKKTVTVPNVSPGNKYQIIGMLNLIVATFRGTKSLFSSYG